MTATALLEHLQRFLKETICEVRLPEENPDKNVLQVTTPEVYKFSLPEKGHGEKRFPYLVVRPVTTKYSQTPGQPTDNSCRVRIIFGVYHLEQSEGEAAVCSLMETVTQELLKKRMLVQRFQLTGELETILYPSDERPYYFGEMMTAWKLPSIEREVDLDV